MKKRVKIVSAVIICLSVAVCFYFSRTQNDTSKNQFQQHGMSSMRSRGGSSSYGNNTQNSSQSSYYGGGASSSSNYAADNANPMNNIISSVVSDIETIAGGNPVSADGGNQSDMGVTSSYRAHWENIIEAFNSDAEAAHRRYNNALYTFYDSISDFGTILQQPCIIFKNGNYTSYWVLSKSFQDDLNHLKKGDFVTITSAIDIRYLTNNSIVFFDCTLGY